MGLLFRQRLSFGVGHVLNDLCASMWFSYLLLFFHKVLKFSNATAGYLLLAGQIADGIATPLVGYESDRRGNLCNYGRRKTWHLIGTISVILSFPPLFMRCIGCSENTPAYAQFIYYVPLVIIFQSGWAATQINHLALIPELARDRAEKVNLNAVRYAFTVLSNILVYCVTWVVFDVSGEGTEQLSEDDISEFRNIVLIVTATGCFFSIIFHIGVKEHTIQQRFNINNSNISNSRITEADENSSLQSTDANGSIPDEKTCLLPSIEHSPCNLPMMKWSDWFKRPSFYQMALLYMCTRLVVNLSQVYIPMYLTDTLMLSKKYIAIVPLIIYVSGFIATILTNPISKFLRNEVIYLIGAALVLGACIWSYFLEAFEEETKRDIFFIAVLLGLGTTIILVMCLSMLSELVGQNTETGAFVYGSMSLTDKLSNGIAIAVIQNLNPC
ncbi:major facilitator superfamily domain-containing protein 12-like isoform X2 [Styela clava]|nr:major facilitator superfamily domain-containing protein 12-like isoform X2 [Styela clava]